MLVVDGSGSVGAQNFEKVKEFLVKIVETLDIGQDATRVALVQFSNNPQTEFSFNDHDDVRDLSRKSANPSPLLSSSSPFHLLSSGAIRGIGYKTGSTQTAKALEYTMEEELIESAGWRPSLPTIVLTITDGVGSGDIHGVSNRLRRMEGVQTMAMGIEPAAVPGTAGLSSFFQVGYRR